MADLPREEEERAGAEDLSEADSLLEKEFRPRTDEVKAAVSSAVDTLAAQASGQAYLSGSGAVGKIEDLIAQLDQKLEEQINLILHHEDFQALEAEWRGLERLVDDAGECPSAEVRVLAASKAELRTDLRQDSSSRGSNLRRIIHDEGLGTPGADSLGVLVLDAYFDYAPDEVGLLERLSAIAAAARCPVIAGAGPGLFEFESFTELAHFGHRADVQTKPPFARWRKLRQRPSARYLSLVLPRYLARPPYDPRSNPVEEFGFREDCERPGRYVWANPAYLLAGRIAQAHQVFGWPAAFVGAQSGGLVDQLDLHRFPTDAGDDDEFGPTEVPLSDRTQRELVRCGLTPLVQRRHTPTAVFYECPVLALGDADGVDHGAQTDLESLLIEPRS